MRSAALLAALLLLVPGCFVFEELDAGRKLMEQHSPKTAKKKPEPAKAGASNPSGAGDDGGLLAQLRGWLAERSARAGSERPQHDPDDVPVRCRIGSRTHFVRKSDCQLRGGLIL